MEPTRTEFLHMEAPGFRTAFYLLTAASLAVMFWQFLGPARLWMKGKPLTWQPDVFRQFFDNVLGQHRVKGSRPRTGAPMHLMIFYGFVALFLATTLLAVATYGPLIGIPNFHKGGYYMVYETVFDVLGLFFVAGLVWALVRRVREDRKQKSADPEGAVPLTTEAKDYWALTVLLMLGVTGYLLEAARISNHPQDWDWCSPVGFALSKLAPSLPDAAYVGVWWFHFAWVWAFFAFLPQMRIKHIVTATLSLSGAPDRPMGELVPVSMKEVEETGKIGVSHATEYSRWHLLSLDACMSCGRCTEVCPAHNVGKPLNPKKVVADIAGALRTGAVVSDAATEEALWDCTTCNACVEACPVAIRHVDLIVDARRYLVAEGKLSGTGATMLRQVGSTGHAWGAAPDVREDWMKGLDVPLARDGDGFDVLFWVGCAGATDPGAVKTTKAVADLMKKAGVRFACLGSEETCTGDAARRVGDEFTFQALAEGNIATFRKYGVKKVVTPCPHCFNTLKNEYRQFGAELEVQHHTEFLQEQVQRGVLRPASPEPGKLAYHDPCYLARVNNVSDAPRSLVGEDTSLDSAQSELMRAATEEVQASSVLAEPVQHGRKTLCCGAGGGRMWFDEEPGRRPSDRRIRQLLDTGAEEIAVACPFCRIMLDAGLKGIDENIRLVDLAEKLHEANR
ncbi:MAG: 4Fe-4S dicluster domain-containing protein [Armatimonadetes bacterium]|nr:4Fe-4S dicluster domain-containing protein [Armatimonadota bacterium]